MLENQRLEFVYGTQQVAKFMNIGRSTVNKYARSLEDAGYPFTKDEKEHRSYTEHDLLTFRSLIDLLSRGVDYDSAVNTIAVRYRRYVGSDTVALVATPSSDHDIAILNAKVDELMTTMSMLSSHFNEMVDERVRSEVAAMNDVLQEIKVAQQQSDKKLDEVVSRLKTHGKRKKFLGLF